MDKSPERTPNVVAASRSSVSAAAGIKTTEPLNTPNRIFARSARLSDSKIGTMPMSSNAQDSVTFLGISALRMKSVRMTQRRSLPCAPDSSLTISSIDFSLVTDVVSSLVWSDGFRSFTFPPVFDRTDLKQFVTKRFEESFAAGEDLRVCTQAVRKQRL